MIDESTRRADPPRRTYQEDPARYGASHGQSGPPGGRNAQGWPQQPEQKPRRSRKVLLGVGATILALAAAAGVTAFVLHARGQGGTPNSGHSSPPHSRPASSQAADQAKSISTLLMTSGATRGKLQPAVSDLEDNCSSLSDSQKAADVATIQQVAMNRKSEYNQATNLVVNALATGAALKSGLLSALEASLHADNDYLQWARQEQQGCFAATNSSAFNDAGNWDTQAASAKTSFANQWNPVAQKYSLPTVTEQDI